MLKIKFNEPVMFSIYGDARGPWYFGYKVDGPNDPVIGTPTENSSPIYPKLIIDFDKFSPHVVHSANTLKSL